MANQFYNLPVPVAVGAGASVDVSALSGQRTITLVGSGFSSVGIQISQDDATWQTLTTFGATGGKRTLRFAAAFMRVVVFSAEGVVAGNADVCADDGGTVVAAIIATAGDGTGPAVSVASMANVKTIVVGGTYTGNVVVQASEDGVGWVDCWSFGDAGGWSTRNFTQQFMRVVRSGSNPTVPGLPIVGLGGAPGASAAGSSGPPSGPAGGDLASTYPNPSVVALTTTAGPTQLAIGAIADGEAVLRSGTTLVGVAIPTLTALAPVDVTKAAASVGVATDAARADHKHDITTAAAGTIAVGDVSADGAATSLARSDHRHALPAPAAPSDVTKAAAAAGVATTVARADHKHDVSTAIAGTAAIGDAAAEGTASSLARSDHRHALPAPAAPVNVTKAAAAAGVATTAARADHKHDVLTAATIEITDATNAEGVATSLARSDHQHAHGNRGGGSLHALAIASGASGFLSGTDKQKIDDSGTLATVAPSNVNRSVAAVGVSGTAARADHKHDIDTAAAGTIAVADTAADGSATTLARSDHRHALPAPAAPTDVTKAAAAAGVATTVARADHKHDVSTAVAGTIAVGDIAAEGAATSLARSDHLHALPAPAAPANVTKAAAAAGVATTVARADHKHDVVTAVAGTIAVGDAAAEGVATSLARSDHLHALPAPAAPADVTKAAAAAGVATTVARADHKHDVTTAIAVSIGVANAEGAATSLARSDHVHAPATAAANTVRTNATAGVAIPGDLAMAASTILARLATGNIVAATVTEVLTLLGVSPIQYLGVAGTAGAPQSVNLPATPATGDILSYRDTDGNASVNNVTFNGNGHQINGAASVVMTSDYGAITFRYNGTEWEIR